MINIKHLFKAAVRINTPRRIVPKSLTINNSYTTVAAISSLSTPNFNHFQLSSTNKATTPRSNTNISINLNYFSKCARTALYTTATTETTETTEGDKKPARKRAAKPKDATPTGSPEATPAKKSDVKVQKLEVPRSFWKNINNQRLFMDKVAVDMQVKNFEDWYSVSVKEIIARGGGPLLKDYYENSMLLALQGIYPEHPWQEAGSPRALNGYWNDPKNQRNFLNRIAEELNVKTLDDFYKISADDVRSKGGASLLNHYYDGSLEKALQTIYPEHNWDVSKFEKASNDYWKDPKNHRELFDRIGEEIGINQLDDWYQIGTDEIQARGGGTLLLDYYNNSLARALRAIYPEHDWVEEKFTDNSSDTSADPELKAYLDDLAKFTGVETLDDWYNVTSEQIRAFKSTRIIRNNGGLLTILKRMYPDHVWDDRRFFSAYKKQTQRWLRTSVDRIFPNTEVIEDFQHETVLFGNSNLPLELDIYIPSFSLALDYNGQQHYKESYIFGPYHNYQHLDAEKVHICKKMGITLINVPSWWDRTVASLAATIHQARPDLIPQPPAGSEPIPPVPLDAHTRIGPKAKPSVKRGDFLVTLSTYNDRDDPTGWFISEKLDGFRAYWDGVKLYSRQGQEIMCPHFFTAGLPKNICLDGELWIDRGQFEKLTCMTANPHTPVWQLVKYCLFDAPSINAPFEERYNIMKTLDLPTHVFVLDMVKCTGRDHLKEFMDNIAKLNGEGAVLRKPEAYPEVGRSPAVMKVKIQEDTEVKFIRTHEPNWSLICLQPDGHEISVQCSAQTYNHPPPVGAILTVTHNGYWKSGKIRYPYFLRERKDMTWEQVCQQYKTKMELWLKEGIAPSTYF